MIRKFFLYLLSLVFIPLFYLVLLVFHVVQVICYNFISKKIHKQSVDLLNGTILKLLGLLGVRTKIELDLDLPVDKPIIIVSNHQSMFDIPMIVWYLRKLSPHFVSKQELGKGIPSISYNLRKGGSVLIDRANRRESLVKISEFAKRVYDNKETAVIFPEGRRSRDGKPLKYKTMGLKILIKQIKDGYVLPVTINNSWKITAKGNFPLGGFTTLSLKVHSPVLIDPSKDSDQLIKQIETQINESIKVE